MSERSAPRPYHHGDLRHALLAAAEAELTESGLEAFSLRSVAKRAGVSHAAPAHHFGDAAGLLTALAAEGFARFLATQQAREAEAEPEPRAQLIAAGLGYVDFALANPALFGLMFASSRPDFTNAALLAAAGAAHRHLLDGVAAVTGAESAEDPALLADASAAWAIVHGLAALLQAGRLNYVQSLPADAREAVMTGIIGRFLPRPR